MITSQAGKLEYRMPTHLFTPAPSDARARDLTGDYIERVNLAKSNTPRSYLDLHMKNIVSPVLFGSLGAGETVTVDEYNKLQTEKSWMWNVLTIASYGSAGACAYHGYKRNGTVWSAIKWSLVGGFFPVISVAIAAAQGFGKENQDKHKD